MRYAIDNKNISTTSVGVGFTHPSTKTKVYLSKHQFINGSGEQQERYCFTEYGDTFPTRTLAKPFKRNFSRITNPELVENYTGLQIDFAEAKELCGFMDMREESMQQTNAISNQFKQIPA
jgi:hypothetical protein